MEGEDRLKFLVPGKLYRCTNQMMVRPGRLGQPFWTPKGGILMFVSYKLLPNSHGIYTLHVLHEGRMVEWMAHLNRFEEFLERVI